MLESAYKKLSFVKTELGKAGQNVGRWNLKLAPPSLSWQLPNMGGHDIFCFVL